MSMPKIETDGSPATDHPSPHGARIPDYRRQIRSFVIIFFAVGLGLRLLRYLLNFPIWGDEASVTINYLDRDWLGLTERLEDRQVVPLFVLWSGFASFKLFGASEWSLRLIPMIVGCASLFLFWYLARRIAGRCAGVIALGCLAVALWPVSMCTFAKPYAFDLFFSLVLQAGAVAWLRRPERSMRLVTLIVIAPIACGFSYPAVFIGGGVGCALLWRAWSLGRREQFLALLFCVVLGGSFVAHYLTIGRAQVHTGDGDDKRQLEKYWKNAFPPDSAARLPIWLVETHVGQMFSYPFGEANGGSVLTTIAVAIGIIGLVRSRQRMWLILLLTPFLLNLGAALLRKYPYGGSCRLHQYFAPAICILAGLGWWQLIRRYAVDEACRLRVLRRFVVLLCVVAAISSALMLHRPYRDADALWTRDLRREMDRQVRPDEPITIIGANHIHGPVFWWYMSIRNPKVSWSDQVDWATLEKSGGRGWVIDHRYDGPEPPRYGNVTAIMAGHDDWEAVRKASYYFRTPKGATGPDRWCDIYVIQRRGTINPVPPFIQWPGDVDRGGMKH